MQCFYDPANDASLDLDEVIFPLAWVDAYQRDCPAGATCQPYEQLQASWGRVLHLRVRNCGRQAGLHTCILCRPLVCSPSVLVWAASACWQRQQPDRQGNKGLALRCRRSLW